MLLGKTLWCPAARGHRPPAGLQHHLQPFRWLDLYFYLADEVVRMQLLNFKQPSPSVPNEGESMPDELVSNDGSLLAMDQSIVLVV